MNFSISPPAVNPFGRIVGIVPAQQLIAALLWIPLLAVNQLLNTINSGSRLRCVVIVMPPVGCSTAMIAAPGPGKIHGKPRTYA